MATNSSDLSTIEVVWLNAPGISKRIVDPDTSYREVWVMK
jgi:hypothetical protein